MDVLCSYYHPSTSIISIIYSYDSNDAELASADRDDETYHMSPSANKDSYFIMYHKSANKHAVTPYTPREASDLNALPVGYRNF